MAVPARQVLNLVIQDDRGFRSHLRMVGFQPDISTAAAALHAVYTNMAGIGTAIAAMTNAKVVSTGFGFEFDIAQEPSSETGTYQLVSQGAHLLFGDGNTTKLSVTIPAPIDGLFLTTTQDNLIVVDPSAATLTAFQTAAAGLSTPGGGTWGAQFFGGQLRSQKPRRRRVLQGA